MEPQKKKGNEIWGWILSIAILWGFYHLFTSSKEPSLPPAHVGVSTSDDPTSPIYTPSSPNTSELPKVSPDHWGKGHQAGYDWAMDHPEVTEDDCVEAGLHSNSLSFEDGCKSALEEKKMDGAEAATEGK